LVKDRTLLFTASYPFNEDHALKYGFDILKRRGFKLRILNLMWILLPKEAARSYSSPEKLGPVCGVEQVVLKSVSEFEEHLKAVAGWKLVVLSSFWNMPLLRALKRAGVGYVQLFTNLVPQPIPPMSARLTRVVRKLLLRPDRFLQETVMPRLPRAWAGIDPPSFVVRGSEAAPDDFPHKTVRIQAHSFDYDRYLMNQDGLRHAQAPAGDYFVHLECPPWECHDYKVFGLRASVTKEEYAGIINPFFDFVERETGKKVLISAHPKHTQDDNVYGGRPFLYGTESLVRHSSGVFCHYSGALNFAVINRKPLCVLSSRRLAGDDYFHTNLKTYTSALKAPVNLIDEEAEWKALSKIGFFRYDASAYDYYLREYIAARPEEKRLLWEMVADALDGASRDAGV
jgi:hypothetical protein